MASTGNQKIGHIFPGVWIDGEWFEQPIRVKRIATVEEWRVFWKQFAPRLPMPIFYYEVHTD